MKEVHRNLTITQSDTLCGGKKTGLLKEKSTDDKNHTLTSHPFLFIFFKYFQEIFHTKLLSPVIATRTTNHTVENIDFL